MNTTPTTLYTRTKARLLCKLFGHKWQIDMVLRDRYCRRCGYNA